MFRKRGADGLIDSGKRAVMLLSAMPNLSLPLTATTITRYLVRLSGTVTSTVALPAASVTTVGRNNASASKLDRTATGEA